MKIKNIIIYTIIILIIIINSVVLGININERTHKQKSDIIDTINNDSEKSIDSNIIENKEDNKSEQKTNETTESNKKNTQNNNSNSNTQNNNTQSNDKSNKTNTTNNQSKTNNNETANVKSPKDKLVDLLLKEGFMEYNGSKTFYYSLTSIPVSFIPGYEGADCAGTDMIHFESKFYSSAFICKKYGVEVYKVEENYYWEENGSTWESTEYDYNNGNRKLVEEIKAYIDENGNFNCNIANCDYAKNHMYSLKNEFFKILEEANVSVKEIS